MLKFVKFDIQNRVAFITLNRPEKRNALNQKLIIELIAAFKKAEDNKDVKVIVLKASGETFSAGADLAHLQQMQSNTYEQNLDDSNDLKFLFSTIYNLEKLVIAQVEGDAIAGGCGLVTVCDIVFAVPEARLGYSEVKIGFVPALVAAFLIRKIGEGRSREMLLSGELINADIAREYGLINFIATSQEIEAKVLLYAQKLVENTSAQSLTSTKKIIAKLSSLSLEEGLNHAAIVNAQARLSEDYKTGIAAFLNKKRPQW